MRDQTLVIASQLDAFQPPIVCWSKWQRVEPVLTGRDFLEVRRELLDHQVPLEHKDELLAALVRQAQHRGGDAARLATIVCLLPGARRLAGRFGDILGWHDAFAELLAVLWGELERLDLNRRTDRIAGRLLATGARRLAVQARRERAWRQHTCHGHDVASLSSPVATLEPGGVAAAVEAGVLDQVDATLVEATRLDGLSLVDVAALLGLSYEAAKKRRRRAEVAWLAWWAPDSRTLGRSTEPVAA